MKLIEHFIASTPRIGHHEVYFVVGAFEKCRKAKRSIALGQEVQYRMQDVSDLKPFKDENDEDTLEYMDLGGNHL